MLCIHLLCSLLLFCSDLESISAAERALEEKLLEEQNENRETAGMAAQDENMLQRKYDPPLSDVSTAVCQHTSDWSVLLCYDVLNCAVLCVLCCVALHCSILVCLCNASHSFNTCPRIVYCTVLHCTALYCVCLILGSWVLFALLARTT